MRVTNHWGRSMLSMFTKSEDSLADQLFGRPQPRFERKEASAPSGPPVSVQPANVSVAKNVRRKDASLIERSIPSVGQYLYHLSHDLKSYTRAETVNAVIGARPAEIQRVAKVAAKLKGRYLALVIDLGTSERGPIGEADMRELERARRMSEEAEAGLSALRAAIENGDLELDGVRAAE